MRGAWVDRWQRVTIRLGPAIFASGVTAIYLFLLAAPVIVVYYSFSDSIVLEFPPDLTLRWYANFLSEPRLVGAVWTSSVIAAVATAGALLLGVPAAYALTRGDLPVREGLMAFFLSPLNLPGLVLAIGILMLVASVVQPMTDMTVVGGLPPLFAAHLIVTVPWVIRTVAASLETADRAPEEAARGLGASPLQAFVRVTLPMIRPGLVAGAIFAFIVSFGNFALSLFFASGDLTTLPVAIYEYVDQYQDPTVAAVSSVVIGVTTAVVVLADRISQTHRLPGARPRA